ncbi:MAG: prolipoprotein diacylglyceryl transferase family protein [Actinomycetota bacterium]|nr:prolipoprotein diacylglyceryl transferase family protein [Actinomycetota bacterium]
MEFTLLGAVFVAMVPLYVTLYWEARRGNAASCSKNLWDVALTAAIVGVFAGRVAAMIGDGVNPITHPADLIIVRGGVATGPAAVAALATVMWIGRHELWGVLDGLAAAALAGLGGWHAGCVVRDACLGTPSDLPWALAQEGSTVTRHPVELYAALILFSGAALIALWRMRGRPAPGVPAGLALALAALTRLIAEPMRPTLGGGPTLWYWFGLVLGLAVTAWAWNGRNDSAGARPAATTRIAHESD